MNQVPLRCRCGLDLDPEGPNYLCQECELVNALTEHDRHAPDQNFWELGENGGRDEK